MPTFAKATDAKGDRVSLLSLHPIAACEAVNSVGLTQGVPETGFLRVSVGNS
ncbi:hypothetical protein [Phormidium nigroviride]